MDCIQMQSTAVVLMTFMMFEFFLLTLKIFSTRMYSMGLEDQGKAVKLEEVIKYLQKLKLKFGLNVGMFDYFKIHLLTGEMG